MVRRNAAPPSNSRPGKRTRRRLPLRLVHGHDPSATSGPAIVVGHGITGHVRRSRTMLENITADLQDRYPGIETSIVVAIGDPGRVLLDESRSAALVVVGSRGLGSFRSLLLGSVSACVAAHAQTPVIVVRPPAPDADIPRVGVVVGVDGSPGSAAAVEFAFEEAAAGSGELAAVYAWDVPPTGNLGPISQRHYDPVEAQQEADRVIAEALAGWQEKYPDVQVVRQAVHSLNPLRTLLEESTDAELVVVGPRGHSSLTGLLLGSVANGLVHHARIPVAVVHGGDSA
jgi:nucleotide-binding universal stress UspA family protein